jgi:signal transduction histidine kinase
MNLSSHPAAPSLQLARGEEIFAETEKKLHRRIDKLLVALLFAQWFLAVIWAATLSPLSWNGLNSSLHIHVKAAIVVGGLITFFPFILLRKASGSALCRHSVAIAQMLMSALLIHISGGRIETHFHIFGSLAFLKFYRDWKVLLTATAIVIIDHIGRGMFYPESIYGLASVSPWRWVEHAAWLVFEDVFLIYACITGRNEMRDICHHQGEIELTNQKIEVEVRNRTEELASAYHTLELERSKGLEASRLAALGEMAGGIAHEINNPLAIISTRSIHIQRAAQMQPPRIDLCIEYANVIQTTTSRIAAIVSGLRSFSRNAEYDPMEACSIQSIVKDTLQLCGERFRNDSIEIKLKGMDEIIEIQARSVQISQVLLNLLNNSYDAISEKRDRWICIEITRRANRMELRFTDSGEGINEALREKIMHPFFTTKAIGKGTGLGLSISKSIVEQHGGTISINSQCPNTQFVIELPCLAHSLDKAS